MSKLIEREAVAKIHDHMIANNLYDPYQSAYIEGRSTETALVKLSNDVLIGMDNKELTILLLLDESAAFDMVNHPILLHRIEHRVGITGKALEWLKSYLSNRKQYVKIGDGKSEYTSLERGVPQGSSLGPTLFNIYTLPVGDIIQSHGLSYMIYADDKQKHISFKVADLDTNLDKVKACLINLKSWLTENFQKLNESKTLFTIFGTPQQLAKLGPVKLDLGNDCIIEISKEVKNLGVIFDQSLTFKSQVASVSKTAHYQLYNIQKARRSLNNTATEAAIHAFVHSKLDYANALYYGLPDYLFYCLQKVQNSAARTLTGTHKREHITPVLQSLHWLKVKSRVHFKVVLLMFKVHNGMAPQYLSDLVTPYTPARSLRSSNQHMYVEISTSLKTGGDRAFSKSGPVLWNRLLMSMRSTTSLNSFKRQLKTHLFKQDYNV